MTSAALSVFASIPSPDVSSISLGPLTIYFYALCILLGIVVATLWTNQRLTRRGAEPWVVIDIALIAVPLAIIGARIFHVVTHPGFYFGEDKDFWAIFRIWEGGIAIFGALIGGAIGAWLGCKWTGIRFWSFADALAPGLLLAQALGRFGNWFNQELYGGPTTLPWGLEIYRRVDPATGLDDPLGGVALDPTPIAVVHPTFLYELLWNLVVAALIVLADRRFRLGHGKVFALYVAGYTLGRFFIELMRTDPATRVFGDVRINVVVSAVVFVGAVLYVAFARRGREEFVAPEPEDTTAPGEQGTPQEREDA